MLPVAITMAVKRFVHRKVHKAFDGWQLNIILEVELPGIGANWLNRSSAFPAHL